MDRPVLQAMEYLFDTDFAAPLRGEDYSILAVAEPVAIMGLEAAVLGLARRVLAPAFDTELLLGEWRVYSATDGYLAGQRVRTSLGALYACHTAAPAGADVTDMAYFTAGDNRPAELVQALTAMVVWGLHLRLLPARLPAERREAAERAEALLADWATGRQPAMGWPRLATGGLRVVSGNSEEGIGWL